MSHVIKSDWTGRSFQLLNEAQASTLVQCLHSTWSPSIYDVFMATSDNIYGSFSYLNFSLKITVQHPFWSSQIKMTVK